MKNNIIVLVIIALLVTACGSVGASDDIQSSSNVTTDNESNSILFYGEYVLDGSIPNEAYVCKRIIFFPDGKAFVNMYHDGEVEPYTRWYYYSFCSESNYVGFSAENASFWEVPVMSENRTLLKFENYVLKRVDEQ